ncbi:MAG TPA: type IV pilus secretin PilQ, partial [Burkholderiaceae bacterium]|nr:type IV pilus secretin PilQ [Burkholderiaceae bacterium]
TGITTAYQVGTRSAQTNLRLHDGETQVLAGLINDNETDSWNKVPGLSDIPGFGRLFSNDNSTHEKTEIILLITPRIVRNLAPPDTEALLVPAGTDAAVGAAPLVIGPLPARSLSLQSGEPNGPSSARASESNTPGPGRRSDVGAATAPAVPESAAAEAASAAAPAIAAPPTPTPPASTEAAPAMPAESFPPPPSATTPQARTLTIDPGTGSPAPSAAPGPPPAPGAPGSNAPPTATPAEK